MADQSQRTVAKTGARAGDFLGGAGHLNRGLVIQVFQHQPASGKRIAGEFMVLEAGSGTYAAHLQSFVGQSFTRAAELIEQVRAGGGEKCTHILNRNVLRVSQPEFPPPAPPEELPEDESYYEGAVRLIRVNAYERNTKARARCIAHHGAVCKICGFDFSKAYGPAGEGLIHVHHRKPLSEVGERYEVDPIKDLVPVCPNCHAMIHYRPPAYTVEQVKALLDQTRSA